ncbi:MAG: inositol monophosphatase [Enhydrobacter sp.]|nr:MAG: inositol monophosphatase [Enhydrobacter sp.]
MLDARDAERVAGLIRETAAVELVPRFRNLAKDEVRLKGPGDVVTVADVAAEQRLASGLAKILPGVPVVGEEAVESDPGLLELIGRPGERCWIVDPLDGTAHFAAGRDRFAIIVCLVEDARTVAGWILDVPGDRLAVALAGGGVTLDGRPVSSQEWPATDRPNGLVGYRIRREFERQLPRAVRRRLGKLDTLGCAGVEYLEILSGRWDFCLYRMIKPWDHAAGALMLTEAGGAAIQFGGAPYAPAQGREAGIIAAATPAVLGEVRRLLEAVEMPLLASKSR